MQWLGLSLLEASLLFGALALAIAALYLGQRNLPTLRVPYLPFWRDSQGGATGGRLRRIRSPFSLLLSLLIVLLLVLALADPHFVGEPPARTVVMLIDHSASMATRDERSTRLAAAKRAVLAQVAALRAKDHFVLLALADRTTALTRGHAEPAAVEAALGRLLPSNDQGDMEQGIRTALSLLDGAARPELLLLSDGALRGIEPALSLLRAHHEVQAHQLSFGKTARNLAVTQLAARAYPLDKGHLELMVSVHNRGPAPERARLRVATGKTPLLDEELVLPARSSVVRTIGDLVNAGDSVEAGIIADKPDLQPADDLLTATLPARRRTRVLASSHGNRYLEAALLLDDYLDVTWVEPGQPPPDADQDVAIFDGVLPTVPLSLPALFLAPFASSPIQPLPAQGERARPFFEQWDREHPLLRGLALGDVNMARAARTKPASDDAVLAHAAAALPLIVEGARSKQRFIALTFDVRESDLPLRAAWPLLVLRAIERLSSVEPTGPAAVRTSQHADTMIEPRRLLPEQVAGDSSRRTRAPGPWQLLTMAALLLLAIEWLFLQRRLSS